LKSIKSLIPIFSWLPSYKKEWLKGDVSAGLTVGVMLIPQGMAYAMLAGLPPIYGLYSALLPLITYAIFGTSRQLAVGPVAMDSLLVLAGVGAFATVGSEHFIEVAILLALVEGVILILLGVLKLGFLVNFLSHPVISGFTSAAALIIGFNQLKHILGISLPSSNYLHTIIVSALDGVGQWNWISVGLGIAGIILIKGIKKINRQIPAALIAVVLSIITVFVLNLDQNGVKIVGEIPTGLPSFQVPLFDLDLIQDLLPIALTLALVAFLEAISVAKAVHAKHRDYEIDPNQELRAIGLANVVGSFFQSFSVTGGFSRTAVNDQSGARTGLASIISALLIAFTLLFLTPLFYHLPNAILASIIVVAVSGLFDIKEPIRLWKTERRDFLMLIVTFFATLTFGIANGIGIGVAMSLALVTFKSAYPHMARLGQIKGTRYYRNVGRFPETVDFPDMLIVRFDAQLFFANAALFRDNTLKWAAQKPDLKVIVFDFQTINNIDSSSIRVLTNMLSFYKERGIELYFAGVKGPVRDCLNADGFTKKAGLDSFFMNVAEAKESYYGESTPDSRDYLFRSTEGEG
tara:strand:+ start:3696 stop:5423 length:1728 start_codon:yes stop_codon:yes gene_type:complete